MTNDKPTPFTSFSLGHVSVGFPVQGAPRQLANY
jgi:hypothetical protein